MGALVDFMCLTGRITIVELLEPAVFENTNSSTVEVSVTLDRLLARIASQ